MVTFLYILFGFISIIAILALTFAAFSFPFKSYLLEISIIAVILSVVSYVDRFMVLSLKPYDTAIQYILCILLFRYLLKVRLIESQTVVSIGFLYYAGVQYIVIPLLFASGIVSENDPLTFDHIGIYIIELITQFICFLISFLLYKFNLGHSHISAPPQDLYIHKNFTKLRILTLISNSLSMIIICSIVYWFLLNYSNALYIILPSVAAAILALTFLSYLEDYSRKKV
ncbi:MAG TPA: hypothetical protein VGE40_09615 [Bacilli bacterium]